MLNIMLDCMEVVLEEDYASPVEVHTQVYEISDTLDQAWHELVDGSAMQSTKL